MGGSIWNFHPINHLITAAAWALGGWVGRFQPRMMYRPKTSAVPNRTRGAASSPSANCDRNLPATGHPKPTRPSAKLMRDHSVDHPPYEGPTAARTFCDFSPPTSNQNANRTPQSSRRSNRGTAVAAQTRRIASSTQRSYTAQQ